jgi:hypothetical protein
VGSRRDEILQVAPGGWVAYRWRHRGRPAGLALADALVRFEERDGRLEPVELRLPSDEQPLTAARLRAVPLGRIAAWANAPNVAANIRDHLDETVATPFPDFVRLYGRGSAHRLGEIPEPPYGDAFYKRVAAAYSDLARQVARPAAELAEVNEIPVRRVHSWVKEARRRGFLPPGRPGKAG